MNHVEHQDYSQCVVYPQIGVDGLVGSLGVVGVRCRDSCGAEVAAELTIFTPVGLGVDASGPRFV